MSDDNKVNQLNNSSDQTTDALNSQVNSGVGIADSVSPVEPVQPPVENSVPVEPVQAPVESVGVVEPVQAPVESAAPVEPVQTPVENSVPVEPVQAPVESSAPVEPVQAPVESAAPVEPVQAPVESAAPVEPVQAPVESSAPVEPVQPPVESAAPVEPVQPPVENSVPVEPVQAQVDNSNSVELVQPQVGAIQNTIDPVGPIQNNIETNETIQTAPTETNVEQPAETPVEQSAVPVNILKNKKVLIISAAVVGAIAVLIAAFFAISNIFFVNGKTIVKTSITKVYDYLLTSVDKVEKKTLVIDPSKDSFGVKGKVSFSSNYKDDSIDLTNIDKYSISYDAAFDLSKDKIALNAALNKSDNKLIDLEAFIYNKLLTVGSNALSLYSYQVQLPDTSIEFKQTVEYSDLKTLINIAKQTTLDNLDEKSISKDDVERKVGNESKKYKRIKYDINLTDLTRKIIDAYINDDNALDILSRLTSSDKETLKTDLKNSIKEEDNTEIKVYIYVDGLFGKFAGMTILSSNDPNRSFELDKINDNYQFYLNGLEEGSLKGNYMNDTKTFNIYYTTEDNKIELSVKEISDTKNNISLNIESENQKVALDANIDNVVSASQQTITVNAKVSISTENDNIEFVVDCENEITKDVEVKNNTSVFSKSFDEMNQSELVEINNKLTQIMYTILYDFYSGSPYSSVDNSDYGSSDYLDYSDSTYSTDSYNSFESQM